MNHPTTTFEISEALEKLQKLSENIRHASYIPQEELLAMLIAGSLVVDTLIRSFAQDMFLEQEIDFLTSICEQINEEFVEIQGSAE